MCAVCESCGRELVSGDLICWVEEPPPVVCSVPAICAECTVEAPGPAVLEAFGLPEGSSWVRALLGYAEGQEIHWEVVE